MSKDRHDEYLCIAEASRKVPGTAPSSDRGWCTGSFRILLPLVLLLPSRPIDPSMPHDLCSTVCVDFDRDTLSIAQVLGFLGLHPGSDIAAASTGDATSPESENDKGEDAESFRPRLDPQRSHSLSPHTGESR